MRYASATYHCTEQLAESDLLPAKELCPWCESAARESLVCLQKDPEVLLLDCKQCHSLSASRMPSAQALSRYYASYYTRKENERSGCKITLGNPRRMGIHLSLLAKKAGLEGRIAILDFGGGDGTLAVQTAVELLRGGAFNRIEITVVDYCHDHVASPDPRISLKAVRTLDDVLNAEHDFVIASAVVEHVPDAPRVLRQLLSFVRPGGLLYARTPRVKSFVLLARALRFQWDFTFPAHVYDLGQDFWEKYFASDSLKEQFVLLRSRPSLVEASFTESPMRAALAFVFKMPWYLLDRRWGFVGGWEIVAKRR